MTFLSDLCSETAQSIDKISEVPSTSWALVGAERISRADYIARAVTCCPLTSTTIFPRCDPVGDTAEFLSEFSPPVTLLLIVDGHVLPIPSTAPTLTVRVSVSGVTTAPPQSSIALNVPS